MPAAQAIPQMQSDSRTENQLQSNIIRGIQPLLKNPMAIVSHLQGVQLFTGSNLVNHGLFQQLQGYFVSRINGAATIYDTAATATTLTLHSSADVTVSLICF